MDNFYEENKQFLSKPTSNKIKAGIMTYFPSVILTLILVALSGLGALIQFDFDIKQIVWSTFFISLALRLISTFLSKYVGSNLAFNKALYSDDMQNLKASFLEEGKNIDLNAFEDYVVRYNLENKKNSKFRKKNKKELVNVFNQFQKLK